MSVAITTQASAPSPSAKNPGTFGVGRFYINTTQIAVAQLCLGLFGILFSLFCFLALPVLLGGIIWAIVDAIMMFTGSVKDNYGRVLR